MATGTVTVDESGRLPPGTPRERRNHRLVAATMGVLGALPTVLLAIQGGTFMFDDWHVLEFLHGHSLVESARNVTVDWGRPGTLPFYLLTYGPFGGNSRFALLMFAVINGILAALVFHVACRLFNARVGLWIGLVWVVLPNRGSARFWIVVAPYCGAAILVLLAVLLLLRNRPIFATLLLLAATFTYEGVAGLALLAIAWWAYRQRDDHRTRVIAAGAVASILGAAFVMYLLSPKRKAGAAPPFHFASGYLSAQFGEGIVPWTPLAAAILILTIGGSAIAVLHVVRPDWGGGKRPWHDIVAAGVAIELSMMIPFMAAGHPVAAEGFFDRAGSVLDLGAAVIFGGLLYGATEKLAPRWQAVVGAVVLLPIAALNLADSSAYLDTGQAGDVLVDHIAADVPLDLPSVTVCPIPVEINGVSAFGEEPITTALRFKTGRTSVPVIHTSDDACRVPPTNEATYDATTRRLTLRP